MGITALSDLLNNIELILYYGTLIKKDNTNTADSVHDLLADVGIIEDDNWRVTGRTIQTPVYRKNKPGCKIIIELAPVLEVVSDS